MAGPSPSKSDSAPAKALAELVCADVAGVQALLGGKPATGMYLLYKLAPPPAGSADPNDKIRALLPEGGSRSTLAFVDRQGFLQRVSGEVNPWHDIGSRGKSASLNCHMEKLAEGAALRVCLIAHPNPLVARAIQAYADGGPADPTLALPARDQLFLSEPLLVLTKKAGGRKQPYLDLPTKATDYHPRGHAAYGGWVLYDGMPYEHLPAVKTAVGQAGVDLARLRYPTGTKGNVPYPASAKERSLGFDTTMTAIVHAFQRDALSRKAFQIAAPARASLGKKSLNGRGTFKGSWAALAGSEVTLGDAEGPNQVACSALLSPEHVEPGVLDAKTGAAIQEWLDKGLRKPDPILIEIPMSMGSGGDLLWGRPELVFAIEMWRELAVAFGCSYGVAFGHTFREMTSAGNGVSKAECSQHKNGLAVDLAFRSTIRDVKDSAHPIEAWPVRMEASWVPPKASAKPPSAHALERDRAKTDYLLCWRLYGHSQVEPTDEGVAAVIAAQLVPTADGGPPRVVKGFRDLLLGYVGGTPALEEGFGAKDAAGDPKPQMLTQEIDRRVAAFSAIVEKLAKMAPADLRSTFFRASIRPFQHNPFEADGGTSAPPLLATDDTTPDLDYVSIVQGKTRAAGARSFLNLTRVGYECGMWRIGAVQGKGGTPGIRNPALDPMVTSKPKRLADFKITKENFPPAYGLLVRLARAAHDVGAVELKISPPNSPALTRTIGLIDTEFARAWTKALFSLAGSLSASGSDLAIRMSLDESEQKRAASFFDAWSDKAFLVESWGDLAGLPEKPGTMRKGSAWKSKLEEMYKALAAAPPLPKKGPSDSDARRWTIVLRPVFDLPGDKPPADGPLVLPVGTTMWIPALGNGGALEWWHFDHMACLGKRRVELISLIGLSYEVLVAPKTAPATAQRGKLCVPGFGYDRFLGIEGTFGSAMPRPPENESLVPEGG